jgi:hypothetical protein
LYTCSTMPFFVSAMDGSSIYLTKVRIRVPKITPMIPKNLYA